MTLSQIISFFSVLAPAVEPVLLNLENNTVVPELNSLIANVSSPDLKALLQAVASGLESFAAQEIAKL
jgi:hypothetical protein